MKRIFVVLVLTTTLSSLFSCGPRRYGCGPNRRCEVKEQKQPLKIQSQIKVETALC